MSTVSYMVLPVILSFIKKNEKKSLQENHKILDGFQKVMQK